MALSRGRSRLPVRSLRRKTSWQVGPTTTAGGSLQGVTGSGSSIAALGSETLQDGVTLVRTRGELLFFLEAATGALDGYFGAFGIGLIGKPAFAAGAASVPTPINELDWDGWLYHRFLSLRAPSAITVSASSITSAVNSVSCALRIDLDSKAMRKSFTDMVFFAALDLTESGTAILQWSLNSRMLFKIP